MEASKFSWSEQRAVATAKELFADLIADKLCVYSGPIDEKGEFLVEFEDRVDEDDYIFFYVNIFSKIATNGVTGEKRYINTEKLEYSGSCWVHKNQKKGE